ncbi:MAG: hypothetical protein ABIQ12_00250 [Opitutaceae bacterium]
METPVQRCVRIAAALENIVGQEAAALGAGDYAAVLTLQERAEPLVAFLSEQGRASADDADLRARIAAVQAPRARSAALLESEIELARAELEESRFAQRQRAKIGPAYGGGHAGRARLCVTG